MSSNKPNIGVLMMHIHSAVTRGLEVAGEKCEGYMKDGYPDAATQDGFITYARALVWVINAHHQSEDNVVFPYLKTKLPAAPFDKLSADHKKMDVFLDAMQEALNMMSVQPQGGEPLRKFRNAVENITEIWKPHIAIEVHNLYEANITDAVMSADEQLNLMKDAAAFSMKVEDPGMLLPFILYNLKTDDRSYMEHTLPTFFLQELLPVVWKAKWEPMKPFLLN
jgi:hemerythrin-like domain-containing protein